MYKYNDPSTPAAENQTRNSVSETSPHKLITHLALISQQIERLLNLLMVLALVGMIMLVFTNVVLRYGFNNSISISVELSRFLFVWITFLGAVTALLRHEHLSVTTFAERLPTPVQALLNRFVTLVMLGCCLMLLKGSYAQTLLNWDNVAPISGIPMGVFYLAGLVAGTLMSITLVYRLLTPAAFQRRLHLTPGEAL